MSTSEEPRIPQTRRRRTDTIVKSERIMAMSRQLPPARSVPARHAGKSHARSARLHRALA